MTSSAAEVSIWDVIAREAARESALWAAALRPEGERDETPVFSPLGPARFALGLESIYEGYLLHYGRPRVVRTDDPDLALLAGDRLYALGLARLAELGDLDAVRLLADTISACAQAHAEDRPQDADRLWAETARALSA